MNPSKSLISLSFLLALGALPLFAQTPSQPAPIQSQPAPILTVPAQTRIPLVLTRPVWAESAKAGDVLYLQTTYPVSVGQTIAVPAGSYVQARVESLTQPTRKAPRGTLTARFTQIILANGVVATLPSDAAATRIVFTVQLTTRNDLFLDNGAELEVQLAAPLVLDAASAAEAVPLSAAPNPHQFRSATRCVFQPGTSGIPGTPGTSGTVIPGTPSTVIPGGPGMPDTVIPGTPSTVIPGSPGTPGTPGTSPVYCPAPPLVLSSVPAPAADKSAVAKP